MTTSPGLVVNVLLVRLVFGLWLFSVWVQGKIVATQRFRLDRLVYRSLCPGRGGPSAVPPAVLPGRRRADTLGL